MVARFEVVGEEGDAAVLKLGVGVRAPPAAGARAARELPVRGLERGVERFEPGRQRVVHHDVVAVRGAREAERDADELARAQRHGVAPDGDGRPGGLAAVVERLELARDGEPPLLGADGAAAVGRQLEVVVEPAASARLHRQRGEAGVGEGGGGGGGARHVEAAAGELGLGDLAAGEADLSGERRARGLERLVEADERVEHGGVVLRRRPMAALARGHEPPDHLFGERARLGRLRVGLDEGGEAVRRGARVGGEDPPEPVAVRGLEVGALALDHDAALQAIQELRTARGERRPAHRREPEQRRLRLGARAAPGERASGEGVDLGLQQPPVPREGVEHERARLVPDGLGVVLGLLVGAPRHPLQRVDGFDGEFG